MSTRHVNYFACRGKNKVKVTKTPNLSLLVHPVEGTRTWKGVLDAARVVKPTMSLKHRVTWTERERQTHAHTQVFISVQKLLSRTAWIGEIRRERSSDAEIDT